MAALKKGQENRKCYGRNRSSSFLKKCCDVIVHNSLKMGTYPFLLGVKRSYLGQNVDFIIENEQFSH